MNAGLLSESDIQAAVARLRQVLPEAFCRQFFGRDRLTRLERIVGGRIEPHFLIDLIVRHQGPQLLAERPARVGQQVTSIRRALLESLGDDDFAAVYQKLRKEPPPAGNRRLAEKHLAEFNWHRGSASALRITRALGLPDAFAGVRESRQRPLVYEVDPIGSLPPLKPFQRGILRQVRSLLEGRRRAMVSSFTGTGKTRMGMEYVVDLLSSDEEPLVIWVAQKGELLDQACGAIEQIWPWRGQECGEPLRVFRFYEGARFDEEIPRRPTLVVASSQQMLARIESDDPFARAVLARAGLLVIDEAHHALAPGHQVLIREYEKARGSQVRRTLGLTATPGRSNLLDPSESRQLAQLFGQVLVVPKVAHEGGALRWFQDQGFLSHLSHRSIDVPSQIPQTIGKLKQAIDMDQTGYRDYTSKFLGIVGEDSTRNRAVLEQLTALHGDGRHMLVFCCNVAQAEMLAQALVVQGTPAGVIHHEIDPRDRLHTIAQFRRGELRLLFNVEVLTTGFDAPKVDTIVMCRPTLSRVLYEQMVGRGMRGPQMGGTEQCEIVDFTSNFGRFQEPQAWEAFWQEWKRPESEDLEQVFETLGWEVVAAEPEVAGAG